MLSFCGGGWVVVVCKVIFVSNPTAVLRLYCRWGCDNNQNNMIVRSWGPLHTGCPNNRDDTKVFSQAQPSNNLDFASISISNLTFCHFVTRVFFESLRMWNFFWTGCSHRSSSYSDFGGKRWNYSYKKDGACLKKWPHGGMAERNLETSSILPLTTLQTSL